MFTQTYKRYALITLTTVYTLSFMDRIMIGMLMQPIKEELLLSDTQLGFLTGIAFALFYATLGIPIARWADRGNRVTIISIAMALWGVMVMLCGLATNFVQMVLVRIGAAVGEAGCMPPAYSLIGDYFPVAERTRALSVYMSGISISILISFMFAGWMNEHYGWRAAFLVVGLPGLVIAMLVKFTLNEPRMIERKQDNKSKTQVQPSLSNVLTTLWRQPSFRYLVIALTLVNFVGIGVGQWFATFFIRNHGMATGELGIWMGLIGGLSGVVGTFGGGYLADRYLANNPRGQLRLIALAVALLFPIYLMMLFLPAKQMSLLQLIPINILILFFYGPIMAMMQQLVADKIRAMAIAVTLLILNLIGMGLGPQIVGILSDAFTPTMGTAEALKVAMAIASVGSLGSAYYFWIAGRTIEADLKSANAIPEHSVIGESYVVKT